MPRNAPSGPSSPVPPGYDCDMDPAKALQEYGKGWITDSEVLINFCKSATIEPPEMLATRIPLEWLRSLEGFIENTTGRVIRAGMSESEMLEESRLVKAGIVRWRAYFTTRRLPDAP